MEDFLIHICKSACFLSIFYFGYQLLLRKETTFEKNRLYLAGGILASFVLPAMYFTRQVIVTAPAAAVSSEVLENTVMTPAEIPEFSWWNFAGILYLAVTAFFIVRLCLNLFPIFRMIRKHESVMTEGIRYIEIGQNTGAFSFFRNVFYNPQKHSQQELEMVLQHEKIHARQLHSLDIMLANLCTAVLWFNPLSWFYRKSIEQNLEFLADRETVNFTASKQAYQQTLLQASLPEFQFSLTNHFYQSSLKKRIVMLNKRNSGNGQFWKGSLVLPLVLAFMLAFNVQTEARIIQQPTSEAPVASEGISAHITRHTTKSELEEFEKKFAEHNIRLNFSRLKYTSEGILTKIEVAVKDRNTGNKGSLSREDPEGIEPIAIVIGKNGQISLGSAKKVEIEESRVASEKQKFGIIESFPMVPQNNQPLVILDGIPQKDRSTLDSLNPSVIKEVNVLKGVKATALYGSRGSNGVIIVTTKTDDSRAPKVQIEKRLTVIDSAENNEDDTYAYESGKNETEIILHNPDAKQPLYVVDKEVQNNSFNIKEIDPEEISSINVLKGDAATKKYGKKGKNGVIEIHTKDAAPSGNEQIFLIKASYSDKQLEALKAEVQEKTGYDLQLNNIERNKEGLITRIDVKFRGKGHLAAANYETNSGIPDIHIGLKKNGGVIVSSSD